MRVEIDTDRLRKKADEELAEAQSRHAQALRFIKQIEAEAHNGQPVGPQHARHSSDVTSASRPSQHRPSAAIGVLDRLRASIIKVLQEAPDGAMLSDIAGPVMRNHKDVEKKHVARALYKLNKKKEIRIIREQSGPVPALYALPERR